MACHICGENIIDGFALGHIRSSYDDPTRDIKKGDWYRICDDCFIEASIDNAFNVIEEAIGKGKA